MIPDFQMIMLPLLKILSDGLEHNIIEVNNELAKYFKLTSDELAELLPSGKVRVFSNRVAWAKSHFILLK